MEKIIIYGKGGIGKSFVASNLSLTFAKSGKRVLHVGCDPKRDSSLSLLGSKKIKPVVNLLEDTSMQHIKTEDFLVHSDYGIDCVEAGGPRPGVGCAGYGISIMFEIFTKLEIIDEKKYDVVIYDVLGDVVCGGFASPLKFNFGDKVLIVVSEELMSLYAANNICHAIEYYKENGIGLQGLILNRKQNDSNYDNVLNFAKAIKAPILGIIPRDKRVSEAEAMRMPVIEKYPESELNDIFFQIKEAVVKQDKIGDFKPVEEGKLYVFNEWANEDYAKVNKKYYKDSISSLDDIFRFLISTDVKMPIISSDESLLQNVYSIAGKEAEKYKETLERKFYSFDSVLMEMIYARQIMLLHGQAGAELRSIDHYIDKHIDYPMLLMNNFSVEESALPKTINHLILSLDYLGNRDAERVLEKLLPPLLKKLKRDAQVEFRGKTITDFGLDFIETIIKLVQVERNDLKYALNLKENDFSNNVLTLIQKYKIEILIIKWADEISQELAMKKKLDLSPSDQEMIPSAQYRLEVKPCDVKNIIFLINELVKSGAKNLRVDIALGEYWDKQSQIEYLSQMRKIIINSSIFKGALLENKLNPNERTELFNFSLLISPEGDVFQYNRIFENQKYSKLMEHFLLGNLKKIDIDTVACMTNSHFFQHLCDIENHEIPEFRAEICSNIDLTNEEIKLMF